MKQKYKNNIFFLTSIFILIFSINNCYSALLTSSITGLPTTSGMSDGNGYFLTNDDNTKTYSFQITANHSIAATLTTHDYFRIVIPTAAGNLVINYDTDTIGLASMVKIGVTDLTGLTDGTDITADTNVTYANGGASTNFVVTITLRLNWSITNTIDTTYGAQTITTYVKESGQPTIRSATSALSYGICASVKVFGFSQNGDAADGLINPTRTNPFNVTGTIVYDLPGYNLENVTDAAISADINTVTLDLRQGAVASGITSPGGTNVNFTGTVAGATSIPVIAGGYFWRAEVLFTNGGTKTTPDANGLILQSNTVSVTNIQFYDGIGKGPAPDHVAPYISTNYYRAYGSPATLIRVTASMAVDSGSGTSMQGDTTITIQYQNGADNNTINVIIISGATQGIALLPYNTATGFNAAWITAGTTELWDYTVSTISGSQYGTSITAAPATSSIYWDNGDAPGANALDAISGIQKTSSSSSITIYWTPLSYAGVDGDFYEYKIYYKETSSSTWIVWDGDDDATLRIPTSGANISATVPYVGKQYTIIPTLDFLTTYNFYVTAVDIFGNEITSTNAGPQDTGTNREIITTPSSISVTISDGITNYNNSNTTFTDLTPANRPLRENNIKVTLNILTSGSEPDTVTVWYTTDMATDIILANTVNSGAFVVGTLLSSSATKTGPNTYVAYLSTLPAATTLIANGNSIRFIVETKIGATSSFSDFDSSDSDPNNQEWTFAITTTPSFTPWPVRILNNVITSNNPTAYPAYYLSESANVTMKIYDIKGRLVAILMDNAPRVGGQNIKDQGWSGVNKAGRNVGPGLYFIHINAVNSSGKVIINKIKKIMVAR